MTAIKDTPHGASASLLSRQREPVSVRSFYSLRHISTRNRGCLVPQKLPVNATASSYAAYAARLGVTAAQ